MAGIILTSKVVEVNGAFMCLLAFSHTIFLFKAIDSLSHMGQRSRVYNREQCKFDSITA